MMTLENYWWPLLLSTVAGLSTSIGALLAVTRTPDESELAFLLGTAIGVMATVSAVEMWWHKAVQHSNWLGVTAAVVAGAVVFALLDPLLPKPPEAQLLPSLEDDEQDGRLVQAEPHALLAVGPQPHLAHATAVKQDRPSASQQLRDVPQCADSCDSPRHPADLQAAGNSIVNRALHHSSSQGNLSQLKPDDDVANPRLTAATRPNSLPGHVQDITSRITGATISKTKNRRYTDKQASTGSGSISSSADADDSKALLELRAHHSGLLRLGVLMAVTMTLHNLPEGFAVAFSAFTGFGKLMALAIAVHNIPEGLVIAVPVYAATNSKLKAIGLAAASGLSEPLGALVALFIFKPLVSSMEQLDYVLAFVGGVMLAVCCLELWPEGRKCRQDMRLAQGILLGSLVMGWTLSIGV